MIDPCFHFFSPWYVLTDEAVHVKMLCRNHDHMQGSQRQALASLHVEMELASILVMAGVS
jgi:hypothetical protein